ncbi:thiol reductant ABC exporter subunit CydC [Halomonas sp. V046]|uniref:thiol reductant ABC exporter subunit CydC n=1 Tax=Halomonas sp. V046 TaxID=3459611 RepID=UPI0040447FBD
MSKVISRALPVWNTLGPWLRLHDQRRRRLVIGVMLMALTALSALGLLAVSGWFITASALTGAALAAGAIATLDVYTPGAGIRLFAVLRTVSRYLERLYNHDTILRLLADLRGRLFGVLVTLDPASLAGRRASDWLNRLTADIDTLDALYLRLMAPPAMALLLAAALVGLVAVWLPQASLWLALWLLVGWSWLTVGQARLGLAASRSRVATLERLRSDLMETLTGLAELEAYAALARRQAQLADIEARLLKDQWRLTQVTAVGNAVAAVVVGVGWLLVLAAGLVGYQAGNLSAPVMVMLPLAAMALSEGLLGLPVAFTQAGATLAAAQRLNDIERSAQQATGTEMPEGALSVVLENVEFRYAGALEPALSGVCLSLAPAERVAICGPSGAGKSTLLGLLSAQLRPQRGVASLGGLEVANLSVDDVAGSVACLTQAVDLFDASLADNLRLAAPEVDDATLWRALEAVDLGAWAASLADGLDTWVGEGGRRLSGGQARRVALARLWLTDPGLVILDEPFAGLDAATAERVAAGIEAWLDGRSVIYLVHEHDPTAPRPGLSAELRCHSLG